MNKFPKKGFVLMFSIKQIIYVGIFYFLILFFSESIYGEDKSNDVSHWYLDQLRRVLHSTYSKKIVYPEKDSISIVSAEKVFGIQLSDTLKPIIDGYKESPESIPKGLTLKEIATITEDSNSRFLSWFMPVDKWKLLEQETDNKFQWNKLGFPLIWDKKPNLDGKINIIIGRWIETIPEKKFEKLIEHAKEWLTPEKQDLEKIRMDLKNGDKVEKDFAIRMLICKNDIKSLPFIAQYLSDKDLQNTCLLAIQELGTREDIPQLIKAFYFPKANISGIIQAMCKIGGREVNNELKDWLNDPEISYEVKQKILIGILHTNYKPAIEILVPFLKDKKIGPETKELLKELGYFPPIKGEIKKETKTKDGVIFSIVLKKARFQQLEPVFMDVRIINNSKNEIELFLPIKLEILFVDKKREVPMTRYGEMVNKPRSNPGFGSSQGGSIILPNKNFSSETNLSKIFDLSLNAEYLLSVEISFLSVGDDNQAKQTIKIKEITFSIE